MSDKGEVMKAKDFKEGDLVRAQQGEEATEGRVKESVSIEVATPLHIRGMWLVTLVNAGYTLTLLDRPAPPLPTTFGSVVLATVDDVERLLSHGGTTDLPWAYWSEYDTMRWVDASALSNVTVLFDATGVTA